MAATGDEGAAPVRRFGKLIRLRPEHRAEYLRLHAEVWPEVLAVITACRLRNYSIFLEGDLLFSYAEYGPSELEEHEPRVIHVDDANRIVAGVGVA